MIIKTEHLYPYSICVNDNVIYLAKSFKDAYEVAIKIIPPGSKIVGGKKYGDTIWTSETKECRIVNTSTYFLFSRYDLNFNKPEPGKILVFTRIVTRNPAEKVLQVHMIKPYMMDLNVDIREHISELKELQNMRQFIDEFKTCKALGLKKFILGIDDFVTNDVIVDYELIFVYQKNID